MSISPLQRSLFQLTARQSRLSREAQLHTPTADAGRRGQRRKAWQRERNSRRSGQALLLAVLLMVFAALLGSTFITVVSLNLNQTARQQNLGSAQAAATAGLTFINDKLNNSALGERWRPYMTTPPPSPSDLVGFNSYYSAFDRAQGWTNNVDTVPPDTNDLNANGITYGTGNAAEKREEEWLFIDEQLEDPTKHLYVKFPDPRGAAVLTGAPQFLAELRPSADGTVRVDVIGQSSDDPSVFVRETRAKPGAAQNPLVAVARTVTNWDFTNNVVPSAFAAANVTAGTDRMIIGNLRGNLPNAPFYVTIGGLVSSNLQSALVTSYNTGTGEVIFSKGLEQNVTTNDFVQVAAALGTPTAIDYDADGVANYGTDMNSGDPVNMTRTFNREAVAYTPDVRNPASILVNGGLAWMGNVLPTGLGTPSAPGAGGSFIRASGLITKRAQTITASTGTVSTEAYSQALNINGTGVPANLVPSNDNSFPFVASTVPNQADKINIVKDGRDRLQGNSDGLRDADSIKPPDISSGGSYSRYLNLTKYSPSIATGQPSASLFGYGEGIYIDNSSDKEKFSVSGSQWLLMDDSRYKRMLFSSEFTPAGGTVSSDTAQSRLAKPYGVLETEGTGANTVATSLEQKHLRGWIGPDEFRPRGVLIELDPTNRQVIITRDNLSDNITNTNVPPDINKAWREPDGTRLALPYYRRVLPWPANGVIYAEGNVRVKGGAFNATTGAPLVDPTNPLAPDPGRSITIVSGNNIYIEGSLNAGKRKVVLLSRYNTVVNPTAVLSRNKAEAYVVSATGGTTLTLGGNDASLFEIGDWVEIDDGTNIEQKRVTNIDLNNNSVTVNTAFTTTTGQILRAVADPTFDSGASKIPYYGAATRIGLTSDVIQRRLRLPVGTTEVRLALQHSAQRKLAFGVKANNGTPPRPNIDLTNKPMANPTSSVIMSGEKLLTVNYGAAPPDFPTADTDTFPMTLPTSGNDLNTQNAFRLSGGTDPDVGLESQMESSHGTPDFEYDEPETGPQNSYGPATGVTTPSGPLYFFLAALSNRYPLSGVAPTGTLPRNQSIDGARVDIPMGTSVAFYSNANTTPSTITNDTFAAGAPETVNQLGFSPDLSAPEDALTIDDTFYTSGRGVTAPPAPDLSPQSIALNNDNTDFALDARRIAINATSLDNHIALKLNNENVRFDATPAGDTGQPVSDFFVNAQAHIPYYRMSRMKIEGPANPFNATTYARLQPGSTIDIQAFVYAQEGSWLNIAGGYFDETIPDAQLVAPATPLNTPLPNQVKTDALGSYVDRDTPGVRDGSDGNDIKRVTAGGISTDRADKLLAYRFHRYNYQVVFTGAIMEKSAALVANERNAAGDVVAAGLVQSWMDKWSTFNFDEASSDFDDAQPDALQTNLISQARYIETPPAPGTPANFGNISYNFDPSLINPAVVATDSGLRLPVLPDLLPG